MTKEEVFNKHCSEVDNWNNALLEKDALIALDEYAQQQSITFAKWVISEGWCIPNSNSEYQDLWTDKGHQWPVDLKTSEELYTLFLQSQK